jgi:hypothetical protein
MSESNATLWAAVVGAIIGGLFAIAGSLGYFLASERHEHTELLDCSKKDLVAELEQNKQYLTKNHFIDLEDGAYHRFGERGFFYGLTTDLQDDLRELYASIHEKNGLIAYYNNVGVAGVTAQAQAQTLNPDFLSTPDSAHARYLLDILNLIKTKDEQITSLIDKILPQLRNLIKPPSPDR